MKLPIVDTPLGIIALFVALIELFLAYPVTTLQGTERFVLVIFMTFFPFFVASLFFFVLWHKPLHLYSPKDIPKELLERYQRATVAKILSDVKKQELEEENQRLQQQLTAPDATVLVPSISDHLAEGIERIGRSDIANLQNEVQARIQSADTTDESEIEKVKNDIQQNRLESKRLMAQKVQAEMSSFRNWLEKRGFKNLPPLPKIVIESPTFLNAYYHSSENTAHIGASISEDSDTVAHIYFHVVLTSYDVLSNYQDETAALVEGYCDYYACSYNGDPYLGEKFAVVAGIPSGWLRNINRVVTLSEIDKEPHHMSQVWSGACWELRKDCDKEKFETALYSTLFKLERDSTINQAAEVLIKELTEILGASAIGEVRNVFQKRGISISN